MKITKEFCSADRYLYDFGACSVKNGFAQIDTRQDAHYFGNWCNPFKLIVFSYIEGDCITVECDTDAEFIDKILDMARWNEENDYGFMIDTLCNEVMAERFNALGLGEFLH